MSVFSRYVACSLAAFILVAGPSVAAGDDITIGGAAPPSPGPSVQANPVGSAVPENVTVQSITAAYAQHQDRLLRFIDTYECELTWDDPRVPNPRATQYIEGGMAYNGERFLQEHRFWTDPPTHDSVSRTNRTVQMFLWDGRAIWGYGGREIPKQRGGPRGGLTVQPDVRSCPKFGPY